MTTPRAVKEPGPLDIYCRSCLQCGAMSNQWCVTKTQSKAYAAHGERYSAAWWALNQCPCGDGPAAVHSVLEHQ